MVYDRWCCWRGLLFVVFGFGGFVLKMLKVMERMKLCCSMWWVFCLSMMRFFMVFRFGWER